MTEKNYEFRKNLLQVHKPNRRMEWAIAGADDVEVTSEWKIVIPTADIPVLYNGARDLEDYFAVSMNVYPGVLLRTGMEDAVLSEKNIIEYQIDETLEENSYKLIVEENHISLIGFDARSAVRAGYFLEDLMNLSESPFVRKQCTTRKSLYNPRVLHSGFGLDLYPDAHLQQLAHAGMTAILLYVKGIDETAHGHLDFNDLIYRASLYGIDVYAYSIMRSWAYPEGEEGYQFYDDVYGKLFRQCPGFKGVFFVGESIEFPSRDENTSGRLRWNNRDENGNIIVNKPSPGWWPCKDWPVWLNMVKDIIRKERPDADIMFETYNWAWVDEKLRLELIDILPTDISLLAVFEMRETFEREGVSVHISDYSLAYEGPSQYFVSEAKRAKERGIRLYTCGNTGGLTWDVGVIPYEPTPYQWLKRYQAMKKAHDTYGLCGNMESHHYGWYPSFISDLAKWMFESPDSNPDEVLRSIAVRDFSENVADTVLEAWRLFSEGIENLVPTGADQYGAFRVGPSYPLLLFKNDFVFKSRPGTLHGGNEICTPMYQYEKFDERKDRFMKQIEWYGRVATLFDAGAELLEGVVENIHTSKQHEAKKQANMARFIAATARTVVNVKQWYLLKLQLVDADYEEKKAIAAEMKHLAEKEIKNALDTIPLVNFDSRLGWEPSMEYMCDEEHLLLKVEATRRVIYEELEEYLQSAM